MVITIDSREQNPLDFKSGGSVSRVVEDGLPFGDYWCAYETGETMKVVFERKTIPDLFGTLTNGMERFKKEVNRALENKFALVLAIEGTLSEVLAGAKNSSVEGKSIIKTVFTLWMKYDVMPVFLPNRSEMKRFMIETWTAIGRNYKPLHKEFK